MQNTNTAIGQLDPRKGKEQFVNKQIGTRNQDLNLVKNIDYYFNLAKDWEDDLPPIVIKKVDGFNIIDEAELH